MNLLGQCTHRVGSGAGARSQEPGLRPLPLGLWLGTGPQTPWWRLAVEGEGADGSLLAATDKKAAVLAQSEWGILVPGRSKRPVKGGPLSKMGGDAIEPAG